MRVLIAGGGTAGHVNPAIAIAAELEGDEILFAGTTSGAEARLVPKAGYQLETIDVRGLDRSRPLSAFPTALRAVRALTQAGRIIAGFRPRVVLGMGGYVSLPASLAARKRRVPVVLHEQNIVLGLSNRVARPVARTIAVSFSESLDSAGPKAVFTGNPVRSELLTTDPALARKLAHETFELDPDRKTLLVFGGSQGARRVNDAATGLVDEWAERTDVQILHVCGRIQYGDIAGRLSTRPMQLVYRLVGYVENMALAYAVADLALCRGGATTVAEIAALGVPAVIVPYPHHRDRQQERHGTVLQNAGAAVVVDDAEATAARIAHICGPLLTDAPALGRMASAARSLGRPDAAAAVAELVRRAAL